jgi:subtilase family serine protease
MRSLAKCLIALLFGSALPVLFAQSKAQDRIFRSLDSRESVAVPGSAHPLARAEFDQGRINANTIMHGVSLVFKPSAAQQAALETLLAEQQQPSSSHYHKWLTPEQYAERFALTSNDIAKVSSWLESLGFTIDRVARSRTQISFTGSVARIESVFKTEIHNYLVNGETHFANSTELSLPTTLNEVVQGVRNLDDFRPRARVRRISPHFTSSISGSHYLTPADFATIYDVKALYDQGLDGTGQKIAVIGDSSVTLSNIATFRSLAGLSVNNPTEILVSGSGTPIVPSPGDQTEAYLDLEWAGAIAKNATISYVYVGNNANYSVWDALYYAIDSNAAPVISSSFGYCEAGLGKTFALTLEIYMQQANSQGQTVISASGDAGAADCDTGVAATQGYAVDVPAAIPEVTGVGGSEFTGDAASTSTTAYWDASNNSAYGSALSFIPEDVWNDTSESIANGGGLSAGGGGASTFFSKPSWQTGAGVPSDGHRDVPDISLNASSFHDPFLICGGTDSAGNQSCTSGFRDSQNYLDAVGGTSTGAPTFAGIVALINQATSSASQGNINSALYTLATSTPSSFHDVTSGNNIVPCTHPSTNCPATTPYQIGFNAGTGYDQASGLGSIDAYNLVTAWPGYAGSYSLSSTTATIASPGATGTSTVTANAASGFTGTVSLTCSSSNSTVGCSLSPTSVALSSSVTSASSTLTITSMAAKVIPSNSRAAGSLGGTIWFAATGGSSVGALFFLGVPMRKRRCASLCQVLALGCLLSTLSCGGGSSSSPSKGTTSPGTPAGTYIVTISGTSGTLKQTNTVSVTVN